MTKYEYDFNCQCGCSWNNPNPWQRTDLCYECSEIVEAGPKQKDEWDKTNPGTSYMDREED